MNIIVRLVGAIALQASVLAAMSSMAMSADKPLRLRIQEAAAVSQRKTTEDLLFRSH